MLSFYSVQEYFNANTECYTKLNQLYCTSYILLYICNIFLTCLYTRY
jgi:hypothetical protein